MVFKMIKLLIYSLTIFFCALGNVAYAGMLDKLINKWNAPNQISEKDFNSYPTVQDYFANRFKTQRTITMNNVSYAAGTIMWDRANEYCERDGGSFVQLKAHPSPLIPFKGSEIVDTPNLQKYYGLFACQGISNAWKVYFDHQNERIFEYPSPNTASDVSYTFE
ncbi:hypothetical protein EC844_103196 [Acinetobacter calcoaceticus]|uniref:Uncharacterized protein n=1 Tax=Acinetobacter calcoaceticus TaxID=471 RepID=A0A4R1XZG6_ACICA|nr:hypothetical protein EC844_103196 [Acinetobacter calcoaceticus]